MANVLVRDSRLGDQGAIRDVTLAAYEEYAALMPAPHWDAYRYNILTTLDDIAPAEQLVAMQADAIVGTVLLYPPRSFSAEKHGVSLHMPWPEVRLLAVAPAARGCGIATALMAECVRRTRSSGQTVLSLHTTDFMEVAMRMYERMGFVRAPEIDFHPLPGLTIEGYRLALADEDLTTSEESG